MFGFLITRANMSVHLINPRLWSKNTVVCHSAAKQVQAWSVPGWGEYLGILYLIHLSLWTQGDKCPNKFFPFKSVGFENT